DRALSARGSGAAGEGEAARGGLRLAQLPRRPVRPFRRRALRLPRDPRRHGAHREALAPRDRLRVRRARRPDGPRGSPRPPAPSRLAHEAPELRGLRAHQGAKRTPARRRRDVPSVVTGVFPVSMRVSRRFSPATRRATPRPTDTEKSASTLEYGASEKSFRSSSSCAPAARATTPAVTRPAAQTRRALP